MRLHSADTTTLQFECTNQWKQRIMGSNPQMRKNALDRVAIDVICADCGTGQCKPIEYFRDHASLTCDGCGAEIIMENKDFRATIAELARPSLD